MIPKHITLEFLLKRVKRMSDLIKEVETIMAGHMREDPDNPGFVLLLNEDERLRIKEIRAQLKVILDDE